MLSDCIASYARRWHQKAGNFTSAPTRETQRRIVYANVGPLKLTQGCISPTDILCMLFVEKLGDVFPFVSDRRRQSQQNSGNTSSWNRRKNEDVARLFHLENAQRFHE